MNAAVMQAPTLALSGCASDTYQTGSLLRLVNVPIEDMGQHGAPVLDRLKKALAGGVPFVKDRKRPRFYEVLADGERFYVHVLRGAKKVLLIARWAA